PSLFSTPLSRPVSPPFPSTTLFRSRDDLRFAVCQIFIRMFGESIDIEKFRLREVGGKENPIRSRRDILPRFQVFQRVDCDHYSSSSVIMVMWLALINRRWFVTASMTVTIWS